MIKRTWEGIAIFITTLGTDSSSRTFLSCHARLAKASCVSSCCCYSWYCTMLGLTVRHFLGQLCSLDGFQRAAANLLPEFCHSGGPVGAS